MTCPTCRERRHVCSAEGEIMKSRRANSWHPAVAEGSIAELCLEWLQFRAVRLLHRVMPPCDAVLSVAAPVELLLPSGSDFRRRAVRAVCQQPLQNRLKPANAKRWTSISNNTRPSESY